MPTSLSSLAHVAKCVGTQFNVGVEEQESNATLGTLFLMGQKHEYLEV